MQINKDKPVYAQINRKNFTQKEKESVFLKYLGKCADCGHVSRGGGWAGSISYHRKMSFYLGGLEIHHIIPVMSGGQNKIKNLILLCPECHKVRHGKKDKKHGTT